MSITQSEHIRKTVAARDARPFGLRFMDWVRTQPEGGIAVMFVLTQLVCIVAALLWPNDIRYLHLANIDVTMKAIAPLGVMALGVGVLMIAGEYDLSVGALYSFLSIVCAHWSNWLGGDIAQGAV